jgi:hypothetical protein
MLTALEMEASGAAQFVLGQAPTPPVSLPPGAMVAVEILYRPTVLGAVTGELHISSNAATAPLVITLSGMGVAAPVSQINVSPAAVAFGEVEVRTSPDASIAATKFVTIRNTGTAPLTLTALELEIPGAAQFVLGHIPTLPVSLMPEAEVTVEILYHPTTLGSVTGRLRISSDAANMPFASVSLTGTGIAVPVPQIEVSPAAVVFDEVTVGARRIVPLTITNPGSASLTLTELEITGGEEAGIMLRRAPTLPVTIIPGAMITLDLIYQPVVEGSVTGTLQISSDASNASSIIFSLSGTGVPISLPQIEVNPAAVAFGEVTVGATRRMPVTIANPGSAPLTLMDLEVGATAPFRLRNAPSLPAIVMPGDEITLDVIYQPTVQGTVTDVLHITTDAANTPDMPVSLSGTGVPMPIALLEVTPAVLVFGEVGVGAMGIQEVTLTNVGMAALRLTEVEMTSETAAAFTLAGLPELPVTLQPREMLSLTVTFAPTTADTLTGILHLRSNAANTPEMPVALSGTGVLVPVPLLTVTPATLDFGEVVVGNDRSQTLTLRNSGTADLHLSNVVLSNRAAFSLSGLPTLPTTVGPGREVTIEVTFEPPTDDPLTGTLRLHSDATNTPEVIVTLRGTGRPVSGSPGGTD